MPIVFRAFLWGPPALADLSVHAHRASTCPCARAAHTTFHVFKIEEMERYNVEELFDYLEDKCISDEVKTKIKDNELSGKEILSLNEGEIKELAPKIGDRVKFEKFDFKAQGLFLSNTSEFT